MLIDSSSKDSNSFTSVLPDRCKTTSQSICVVEAPSPPTGQLFQCFIVTIHLVSILPSPVRIWRTEYFLLLCQSLTINCVVDSLSAFQQHVRKDVHNVHLSYEANGYSAFVEIMELCDFLPEEKDAVYLIEVPILLFMRLVKAIVFRHEILDLPGAFELLS